MTVSISDRQTLFAADLGGLESLLEAVLRAEGAAGAELSLSLVDDAEMAGLHQAWLGKAGPTDVISFALGEPGDPDGLLGEVVVSVETALREARARGLPTQQETARYAVHGLLHLLGYDDLDPEAYERMHARQEELLEEFGAG